MSKNPAVLWYSSDFLTGVTLLNHEQVGQYAILLSQQHQLFPQHFPENHMISICGSIDSPVIKKFIKDKNGFYYNKRMEEECIKRIKYCNSRSNNNSGRKRKESHDSTYDKSHDKHMSEHMGNGNDNENKDINNSIKQHSTETIDADKNQFDVFRKNYPGSKRGLDTEYENFKKKNKNYKNIIPLLLPALENQKKWRVEMAEAEMFVPEWKMFQTWINQKCWEMEKPEIIYKPNSGKTGAEALREREARGELI